MTPEERISEISKECGISCEVVRMVLKAEMKSAARSLANGEHAVLLGRCIIKPRKKNGETRLSCAVSTSLMREVQEQVAGLSEAELHNLNGASDTPLIPHIKIEQLKELM